MDLISMEIVLSVPTIHQCPYNLPLNSLHLSLIKLMIILYSQIDCSKRVKVLLNQAPLISQPIQLKCILNRNSLISNLSHHIDIENIWSQLLLSRRKTVNYQMDLILEKKLILLEIQKILQMLDKIVNLWMILVFKAEKKALIKRLPSNKKYHPLTIATSSSLKLIFLKFINRKVQSQLMTNKM